jgi:hypothetical protein
MPTPLFQRSSQEILNDFGELKYITHAKERIVWADPLEPSIMLRKYIDNLPLRAIASQHCRSIDQVRDFAAKIKTGTVTPFTHFACFDYLVYPYHIIELEAQDYFRDGTPVHRAPMIYKVPGKDCFFGATTGFMYSEVPTARFLGGDSLGLEGDTCYTIPDGSISVSAAFKRTFWNQLTEHSVVMFNPQIISCIAPWSRDYSKPSVNIHRFLPDAPSILEDMLYIADDGVLHSFIPDVLTKHADHYLAHLRVRGNRITYKIDISIISLMSELLKGGFDMEK